MENFDMFRRLLVTLAVVVAAATLMLAQTSSSSPAVQMKAAQYKEQVEGDLKGALTAYEKVVAGKDRTLAAQALLAVASIHQRLGDGQAEATYQRLIREFPEQTTSVAFARRKVPAAALPAPASPATSADTSQSDVAVVPTADQLKVVAVFDRKGKLLQRVSESEAINMVSISPDGERVAYSPGRHHIVVLDLVTRTRTEVSATGYSPSGWSPDGTRLVHLAGPKGGYEIHTISSLGAGDDELLLRLPDGLYHWTSDGRFVIAGLGGDFVAVSVAPNQVLPVLDGRVATPGGRVLIPLLSQVAGSGLRVSPDNRFMAYTSNGVRESEIMVRPSPLAPELLGAAAVSEWKASSGGALGMARWRADGGELYYIAPDGGVMAVATSTDGPEFSAKAPVRLFRAPAGFPLTNVVGQRADVSGDGQRFVFLLASSN